MITEEIRAAEEELVRYGTGVGGASRASVEATSRQRAGSDAHAALTTWEKRSCAFPYTETVLHYQAVGRDQACPALVRRLSSIPSARKDSSLSAWLPMTCDQEVGGYLTYAGLLPHLMVVSGGAEAHRAAGGGSSSEGSFRDDPERVRARLDEVTIAVLGELVRTEAAAAGFNTRASGAQARLRAATQLLVRVGELAPAHRHDTAVTADLAEVLARTRVPLTLLSDTAERAAKAIQEQVSTETARTVALTVLPVTRLHDEIMFIRTIQLFEALYEQIGLAVAEARDVILGGQIDEGADVLARVIERMAPLSALFRLLGTMPVEAFAVIRGYTSGRSAVQSRSYRRIEAACAPPPPTSASDTADTLWTGSTLQEAFLEVRNRPDADRLAFQLKQLDASWRGMKRSHWGITLRIIGDVPGTGGTAGASYLKTASDTPLFTALAGKEDL